MLDNGEGDNWTNLRRAFPFCVDEDSDEVVRELATDAGGETDGPLDR